MKLITLIICKEGGVEANKIIPTLIIKSTVWSLGCNCESVPVIIYIGPYAGDHGFMNVEQYPCVPVFMNAWEYACVCMFMNEREGCMWCMLMRGNEYACDSVFMKDRIHN